MHYFGMAIVKAHTSNKLFTYKSAKKLPLGSVLTVPFGTKQVLAIVINKQLEPNFDVKKILSEPLYVLPSCYLKLMIWMFDYCPEDNGPIANLFLPNNLLPPKDKTKIESEGSDLSLPKATKEQAKILEKLIITGAKRVLLHGDTGTGKTRVFLEVANETLKSNQSVLILTPEIGLTPQLVDDIKRHLPYPVVLTHSEMTETKRRQAWHWAYNNNKPAVFVGPRSALFLPISNLGLIVIDESHDGSYKQLQSPKYNALHVAGKLATLNNATLIHSTATPNIDEYEIAKAHNFLILSMTQTAAGNKKGSVKIVDIRDRNQFTKSPYLSTSLVEAIETALTKNEQIMIYLNRRGSARLIQCSICGWQEVCPNCDLPLIYHHDKHLATCHICSYNETVATHCPVCQSTDILFKVIGTKSLYEHITQLFKSAKVQRFDTDSTKDLKFHNSIGSIKAREIDIIIGTQLITKGIDLPNLSVVGIINADSSLNLPDFRAEEVAFQQLYQAAGRAMRGHIESQVFIQTRLPEHPVIKAAQNRSWETFYTYELAKRTVFLYPPAVYLAVLKITKKSSALAQRKSLDLSRELSKLKGLQILGPSPSYREKSPKGYSWQIIIKAKKRSILIQIAKQLPADWIIDIDPSSTL